MKRPGKWFAIAMGAVLLLTIGMTAAVRLSGARVEIDDGTGIRPEETLEEAAPFPDAEHALTGPFWNEKERELIEKQVEALYLQINGAREENGAAPLKWNADLHSSAMLRAMELTTSFSHTRPDGRPFWTSECSVRLRVTGEILARNGQSSAAVFREFMRSEAHRQHILNPAYSSIGIYLVPRGEHAPYWAVIFGSDAQ